MAEGLISGHWIALTDNVPHDLETEYVRADLIEALQAQQAKDWENINLKADFIEKTLDQSAADQERIEALQAERDRLETQLIVAAGRLTWAAGIIERDEARDLVGSWASELHDAMKNEATE